MYLQSKRRPDSKAGWAEESTPNSALVPCARQPRSTALGYRADGFARINAPRVSGDPEASFDVADAPVGRTQTGRPTVAARVAQFRLRSIASVGV